MNFIIIIIIIVICDFGVILFNSLVQWNPIHVTIFGP